MSVWMIFAIFWQTEEFVEEKFIVVHEQLCCKNLDWLFQIDLVDWNGCPIDVNNVGS